MKLSVITPLYNGSSYIEQAIQSVRCQKISEYDSYEHIIVYAPSIDDSLVKIRKYSGENTNVKVIEESRSKGIAAAMNLGIAAASGDVISVLHSDDYYSNENVFSKVIVMFQANSMSMWCYSNFSVVDRYGRKIRGYKRPFAWSELKKYCIVPHPTVFIRKEVFEEFGVFNERYKCAMDYEYWLKISRKYEPYVFLNDEFAMFRQHDKSMSVKSKFRSSIETRLLKMKYYFT